MEVVHIAMLGISQGAADQVAATGLAVELAEAAGHRVVARAIIADVEPAIRVQLATWIIDPNIDVVIVTMDTRSKAVSAALRPLVVERVPGLIEAARCENTYVIVLLPGASSVKAAMQHRILARLDSRTEGSLVPSMPRVTDRERTATDVAAAPAAAVGDHTQKDAVPAPVENERTTSGAGLVPRLPAKSAPIAPPIDAPPPGVAAARKHQPTGRHVVHRNPSPFDVQTAPIDLVAMMPDRPPGADDEIDLDKDIPVFLPDPASPKPVAAKPERSAPRTRPPTAPPPGRVRQPTAQVQVIPPAAPARPPGRARVPTPPPPPPGSYVNRTRPATGANRPATLAVAVVPPPRPPPVPAPVPAPVATGATSGAATLAEAWSAPTAAPAAPPAAKPAAKSAGTPELSQAGVRLSQMWSTSDVDAAAATLDGTQPAARETGELTAQDLAEVTDEAAAEVAPPPTMPAATPAAPAEPAVLPPIRLVLATQPPPKQPARPREEPSFAASLDAPVARESARMPTYTPARKGKRGVLLAVLLLAVGGGGVFAYSKLARKPAAVALVQADAAVAVAIDAADAAEVVVDAELVAEVPIDAPEVPIDAADAVVAVEPDPAPVKPPRTGRTPKRTPKVAARTPDPKPPDVAKPPDVKPPDPKPDPKPQVAAGCDEVSCVMDNYARACCARYKPAGETFAPKRAGTPDVLDKTMIRAGVAKVKPAVIACGEQAGSKGTVKIAMVVGADGGVRGATVATAPDAGLGTCVASALKRAKFQPTVKGATFTYPFVF